MTSSHVSPRGLRAAGLTKRYGRRTVVDDVSFTVRPGEVTGFLGPNGSGKSTTMRMLTGLSRPHAGQALLDGVPVRRVVNPGLVVGVLLDAGAVHNGRSVRETMRIVTHTLGLPREEGDEWLERVGLSSVAGRRAGALSLGMRQRLGLATALVSAPRFLVLDEPMNGLDPEGIGWVKTLLRQFADDGGGVLLSTHLIGEIDGVADRVVVIDRGRIVTEALPESLGARRTVVSSEDDAVLARALEAANIAVITGDGQMVVQVSADVVGRIARDLGIALTELRTARTSLTDYVLDHTTGEFAASTAGRGPSGAPARGTRPRAAHDDVPGEGLTTTGASS